MGVGWSFFMERPIGFFPGGEQQWRNFILPNRNYCTRKNFPPENMKFQNPRRGTSPLSAPIYSVLSTQVIIDYEEE